MPIITAKMVWLFLFLIMIRYTMAQPYRIGKIILTNNTINVPADYTWRITTITTTNTYNSVTMSFPSTVTLPSVTNINVEYVFGGVTNTISALKSGNSLTFNYPNQLQGSSQV